MFFGTNILEMELHKPKYRKSSYGGTRDNRSSGYRVPRDDRSPGYRGQRDDRSSGYRGPRNDRSSGYRGQRDDRSSGYRGPRNDRSSGYRGQRDDQSSGYRGPRNDRSSGYRGPRSDRSSGYNQGSTRFLKDRTPIHSRNNFGTTKYPLHRDESYRKNSRDNNSNSFYSTLRKKLFVVLGEKKCTTCGFDDERALGFEQTDDVTSFDYIKRAGAASSWEKYISDPELAKIKLQVTCLNCNMIKQKKLD